MADAQIVELLGRNRLIDEILRAGLEVALPIRDRGIDLLVYADTGDGVIAFSAKPVQMKAASGQSFSIDCKYDAFPNLILAFVWNVTDAANVVTYAMTYADAIAIGDQMGYTQTESWRKGRYHCTSISGRLLQLIEAHRMTPARWKTMVAATPPSGA